MKIAIYPYEPNFDNKYIERMVEAIRLAYPNVKIKAFSGRYDVFSLIGYDYVWLNWYENPTRRFKLINFMMKLFNLLLLRLMNVKIVATFHNKQPHESTKSIWDRLLFDVTFKVSNRILILSSESKKILSDKYDENVLKKIFLIPHPTYDCRPKTNQSNDKDFSILFFGHLRPYKNIELILEIARQNPNIKFTVAGKPKNNQYKSKLIEDASTLPNVHLIPHFISPIEIDQLIEQHSILLLPYNLQSSLNSGVVIHAICKGINIIIPAIGTVNELDNRNKIYNYSYDTEEEHLEQLNNMIKIAKKEYECDYEKYKKRITDLYKEINAKQTPLALSLKIKELFV